MNCVDEFYICIFFYDPKTIYSIVIDFKWNWFGLLVERFDCFTNYF